MNVNVAALIYIYTLSKYRAKLRNCCGANICTPDSNLLHA